MCSDILAYQTTHSIFPFAIGLGHFIHSYRHSLLYPFKDELETCFLFWEHDSEIDGNIDDFKFYCVENFTFELLLLNKLNTNTHCPNSLK